MHIEMKQGSKYISTIIVDISYPIPRKGDLVRCWETGGDRTFIVQGVMFDEMASHREPRVIVQVLDAQVAEQAGFA